MTNFELSFKEASYLVAILEANRQTALQLLAADHFYQPSLLPRLKKFQQMLNYEHLVIQKEQNIYSCCFAMVLSKAAEKAFDAAIEAAYIMEEAGKRWTENSKEIALASMIYDWRIEEYDALRKKQCSYNI